MLLSKNCKLTCTLNSNLNTIESNITTNDITSSISILDLFKTQKQRTTKLYFVSSSSILTDYPTSLTDAGATLYSIVTIYKMYGTGYITVNAVKSSGEPNQIIGYTNGSAIIYGNIL